MVERLAPGARWRCWVAVAEGQLVGTLWLQLLEKLPNPGDEAVFLWSTPDSRRLYERHGFAVRDDLLDRR
jgi:hypothetical protein